jgi:hypothetical protein
VSVTALAVLACSGHVLIDAPIFFSPVLAVVIWMIAATRRARREEADEARELAANH